MMGGRESKVSAMGQLPSFDDLARDGMSKEQLAAYLASVSDMADTGSPVSGAGSGVPEIRVNNQPVAAAQTAKTSAGVGGGGGGGRPSQLRSKLQRQLSSTSDGPDIPEHLQRQLDLLDGLESKDDSRDWAHMRDWLLYHLQENLDDHEEHDEDEVMRPPPPSASSSAAPRGRLRRQMSMDSGRITQRLRLGQHQLHGSSTDSTGSSGHTSYQNSFDSTGMGGGADT